MKNKLFCDFYFPALSGLRNGNPERLQCLGWRKPLTDLT